MATLKVLDGPQAGRRYDFSGGRVVIGRGDGCEVQLFEGSISRQHAAIELIQGQWHIEDLQSQNGLWLDDERRQAAILSGTVAFRLGNVHFEFSVAGARTPPVDVPLQPPVRAATPAVAHPPAGATRERGSGLPAATSAEAAGQPSPAVAAGGVEPARIEDMASVYPLIEAEFGKVIVGQRDVLEQILIAIAANGHCLMIGLPGLAKTLMVSTLARILKLTFKRIQFTPDLMPSDILGTDVLETGESGGEKHFRFIKGPVFTNMLLADEINRTPPKTQSSLLESMQERQVTISNSRFPLPEPFFVLATQNPLEQEGTYPLPEAQLDRFMFNVIVGYPSQEEEETIVQQTTSRQSDEVHPVLAAADLLALQAAVRDLPVSPHVIKYATALVRATRPEDGTAPDFIREHVSCGAGPRAAQFLILGAKAKAVMHGRVNVSCADVRALALPVMRHRIFTNFTADSEGIKPDNLITRLTEHVHEPAPRDYA
ncbi:MAG: ATPase family associated with various cellular activities (AAA) [Lentisphaerae bacterium ADurb.BinA184]|nr:MAG: ATPase family associated with various cellular activities (AAA) [Lentisphaerae bacterium ADurb.BinA184]